MLAFPSFQILKRLGYKRMILQYGRGEFTPDIIKDTNFEVEAFRFKDSIRNDIQQASLVISHAGMYLFMVKPLKKALFKHRIIGDHHIL